MSLGGSMITAASQQAAVPGAVHLPSVFIEGTSLDKIATAPIESIHREALLLMPAGGVFDPHHKLTPRG